MGMGVVIGRCRKRLFLHALSCAVKVRAWILVELFFFSRAAREEHRLVNAQDSKWCCGASSLGEVNNSTDRPKQQPCSTKFVTDTRK
jgi:hypothetical protein